MTPAPERSGTARAGPNAEPRSSTSSGIPERITSSTAWSASPKSSIFTPALAATDNGVCRPSPSTTSAESAAASSTVRWVIRRSAYSPDAPPSSSELTSPIASSQRSRMRERSNSLAFSIAMPAAAASACRTASSSAVNSAASIFSVM